MSTRWGGGGAFQALGRHGRRTACPMGRWPGIAVPGAPSVPPAGGPPVQERREPRPRRGRRGAVLGKWAWARARRVFLPPAAHPCRSGVSRDRVVAEEARSRFAPLLQRHARIVRPVLCGDCVAGDARALRLHRPKERARPVERALWCGDGRPQHGAILRLFPRTDLVSCADIRVGVDGSCSLHVSISRCPVAKSADFWWRSKRANAVTIDLHPPIRLNLLPKAYKVSSLLVA
jgi:hypothetical protein